MAKLSSTQIYGDLDVLGEIKNEKLNSHFLDLSHVYYVEATGSNNTYIANIGIGLDKYVAGLGIAVKIPVDSTGNSTINIDGLGAVTIKKANGNNATNLKKNSVYSMRLSKDDNGLWYFFLQGEGGSGNAAASDILTGKTASVDAGDIIGTMIDYGNKEVSPVITTNHITKIKFTDDKCGEIYNKLNINGYVDGNTVIHSYCYGIHPECIKTGQVIGANGLGYVGSYDKESANPINTASILANKVGFVNGNKIIGTMSTVTSTLSGDSGSAAFKNSNIVGAQSNNDVSGFDYNITGYVNKPRVHIPNIIPQNIKAGVKIGSEKANIIGTFTGDANAAAGDIISGKTAYVNGSKITGNLECFKVNDEIPDNRLRRTSVTGMDHSTSPMGDYYYNSQITRVGNLCVDNSNSDLYLFYEETNKYFVSRMNIGGSIIWKRDITNNISDVYNKLFNTKLIIDSSYIYFVTNSGSMESKTIQIERENGSVRWNMKISGLSDAFDNKVYAIDENNKLIVFHCGRCTVDRRINTPSNIKIYQTAYQNSAHDLYIFCEKDIAGEKYKKDIVVQKLNSDDGTVIWEYKCDTYSFPRDLSIDGSGRVYALGDDNVYILTRNGKLSENISVPASGDGCGAYGFYKNGEEVYVAQSNSNDKTINTWVNGEKKSKIADGICNTLAVDSKDNRVYLNIDNTSSIKAFRIVFKETVTYTVLPK